LIENFFECPVVIFAPACHSDLEGHNQGVGALVHRWDFGSLRGGLYGLHGGGLIWLDIKQLAQGEHFGALRGDNPVSQLLDAALEGQEVSFMTNGYTPISEDVEDVLLAAPIIDGGEHKELSVAEAAVVVLD